MLINDLLHPLLLFLFLYLFPSFFFFFFYLFSSFFLYYRICGEWVCCPGWNKVFSEWMPILRTWYKQLLYFVQDFDDDQIPF
jgi:hypothetical protein